ncbi:UNVERIFIED_ORG: transposase-like protein [Bradyrhizobium japonicum]
MSDDDQKLRVRLVGRNGRRRYEAASKERLVAACLEPGVSVSRLALEHGVNANLLRKWIKTSMSMGSFLSRGLRVGMTTTIATLIDHDKAAAYYT